MSDCKGCNVGSDGACGLKDSRNCPCVICIIKMVCNTKCDERHTYWDSEYARLERKRRGIKDD